MQLHDAEPSVLTERLRSARGAWRAHQRRGDPQGVVDLRIVISATFTADPLTPFLGAELLASGYANPAILHGPYNQVVQTCLNPASAVGEADIGVLVVLWRLEDLVDGTVVSAWHENTTLLLRAVDDLSSRFEGAVIVALPPRPRHVTLALQDFARPPPALGAWYAALHALADLSRRRSNVYTVDMEAVVGALGESRALDERKRLLYRQPYSEPCYFLLARAVARIIAVRERPAKKCLVLDCDNTLWGGIVGEDGIAGLQLGDDFPGNAFREFQRQAKQLRDVGVFIALNSKNNPADVWEVFDRHNGMVLRREDISIACVNWELKSDNLRTISAQLNIGLDALVFVDDSPFELAEVARQLPEVTCLQVPAEAADLPRLLQDHAPLFDRLDVTPDDLRRVDMMRQELHRRDEASRMTNKEFLASLGLVVHVYAPAESDLARVTQLLNKTNQFNLTVRRYALEEVRVICTSPQFRVTCISVVDRFGEYGLVGLVIVEARDGEAIIDSLLMSCRVLGRGIEAVLLWAVARDAQALACATVRGRYVPTAKNAMVADLLPRHGYVADVHDPAAADDTDGTTWRRELATPADLPDFLSVVTRRPG